ncbi:type II secretion system protein [Haladaptatus pallidirubidus]|uniref:Type II secretion system protein n=1 Tax=Haladaptatus pallidirubidus TaxID=1008152 RepID=A0AAV3UKR3_9EURY|nr:type II secretion system protein [Haladaptatus pallidirubidus]
MILTRLASLYPWAVSPDSDIERALGFLGAETDSTRVIRAGNGAGILGCFVALVVTAVVPAGVQIPTAGCLFAFALLVSIAVRRAPVLLATAQRTQALGDAPDLVARAVLRMRIEPTAETAAEFSARTGDGPLSDSLDDHVRRAIGSPDSGFSTFAEEWKSWNPALNRAVLLVSAASEAPPDERERTLDRALSAILDGTREEMARFVSEIREPATAMYAFGVLLPLALVAVLPSARAAGVPLSPTVLVVVYDIVLPIGLVVCGVWLLIRRPVAFPPPDVTRAHSDVPSRRWDVLTLSCIAGAVAFFGAGVLLPDWTRWVAGAGCTLGCSLVGLEQPTVRVRNRVRAVEENLTDALYLVGRRVNEGIAVERSISVVSDEIPGETGELFTRGDRIQRRLRLGVRESFLGDHGALSDVPSPRARSAAALLALSAREGRPAGGAVLSMASHLDDLQQVEREARRELAQVTGTLRHTAALFGPLVSGATVALAGGIGDVGTGGATSSLAGAFPADVLGLTVGVYVLLLSAILTTLTVGLEHGLDGTLVRYRVGNALLSATAIYLAAFALAGTVA